jgi:hypothetical protein
MALQTRFDRFEEDADLEQSIAGYQVEFLDHGRSILWSQATNTLTDLTYLKESAPDLAARFGRVSRALEASTFQDYDTMSASERQQTAESQIEHRRLLTQELKSILEQIRELPTFQNFMKPLPFSELRLAAAGGPVILLNASSYRCDALIVTVDSPPHLVPLPNVSFDEVSRIARDFREDHLVQSFRARYRLPVLWHAVVRPVLEALGYMETSSAVLKPRVWWCPTGPFSFIPIHAAGPYTKSGGPDLTKHVLSSYTPTLQALLRARC